MRAASFTSSASTRRAKLSRQMARWSIQQAIAYSHRPMRSTVNEALKRSLPSASMGDSRHARSPGPR